MLLTRTNFGHLLKPGQSKIFFDSYSEFPAQYTSVFKLENSSQKEEKITRVGSFGLWQENQEGNPISEDVLPEGEQIVFKNKRFDKGYHITWEMVQDEQNGIWNGRVGKGGNARSLGRSLRATVESEACKVLDDGFSNEGYDGKALFATDHPMMEKDSKTESENGCNKIDGALSEENLKKACVMLRSQKDESGAATIAAVPNKLIVPPDLEFTAKSILNYDNVSQNSSSSTLPNLDVVVLDYLTNTQQWFVQARGIDNLIFFWRETPVFGSQNIEKTMDWFFYGYARWSCGYLDWRGIVGGSPTTTSPSR